MSKHLQASCNDDLSLKQLLTSWKLENILSHLIAEEVNLEVLKVLKIYHIQPLLNKFSLGTQIRFEHCLEQWRSKIGKPLKHRSYEERSQIKNEKDALKEITTEKQCNGTSKKSTVHQKASDTNTCQDIKEILSKYSPDGPELLETYNKNHTFSSPERSYLINIIINYYLQNNLPFSLHTSFDLENSILTAFPTETLEMYRNDKQSKLYSKYLSAKAVYSKEKPSDKDDYTIGDEIKIIRIEEKCKQNKLTQCLENQQNRSLLIEKDNYEEHTTTVTDEPTEILLQVLCRGCRKFIKIFEPFVYADFLSAVCTLFNIASKPDLYAAVSDCEILAHDFKNVVLQYYKLPTFTIELKEKALPFVVTKFEDFEISQLETILPVQPNPYTPVKLFDTNLHHKNSSIQIINNYLPDFNEIRNIPALMPIVKMSDDGKRLENKHRATIAKAIIDECLNYQPERVLKRQEFFTLTQNLIQAFPREVESTYFIPAQPNVHARGKLWNAYNNKRKMLTSSGVLDRRHHGNIKRIRQSDDESERTYDKVLLNDYTNESNDFSLNSSNDWDTIKQKWSETYQERRKELLKDKLTAQEYMEKYSILKSIRGIELMEIDVNILHPSVLDINNWLSLYQRILDRVRPLRRDPIPNILDYIDSSNDEKYRASMALLTIPYIFPYNAKRSENATKHDIQKRFIKEYTSVEDLESDIECADLQLRFVHDEQQISYAEFNICGQIFKCCDLWQALNSMFHYIIALNLEYPRVCLYAWQFIQLAIFQVEIKDGLQPNVEIILNDLCMS